MWPGGNTAPETTLLSGYGVDTLRRADNVHGTGSRRGGCPDEFQRGLTRRGKGAASGWGTSPTLLPARAWPGTPSPVQFYTRHELIRVRRTDDPAQVSCREGVGEQNGLRPTRGSSRAFRRKAGGTRRVGLGSATWRNGSSLRRVNFGCARLLSQHRRCSLLQTGLQYSTRLDRQANCQKQLLWLPMPCRLFRLLIWRCW